MANRHKIITMTELAVYDKHEGPADRAANDYFRHDYIYRNNLGTRLAVGLGGVIVLAIYWIQALAMYDMDLFEFNIQEHVTDSVMFLLAILAVYSLIGSIQGTRQYYLVQKRLSQYQAIVRQLERLNEREYQPYEEELLREENEFPPVRNNTSPPIRTQSIEHTRAPGMESREPRQGQPPPDYKRRPRPITAPLPVYNRPPRPRTQPGAAPYGRLQERDRSIERTRAPESRRPAIDPSITPDMARSASRPRAIEPMRPPIEHTRAQEPIRPPIEHTRAAEPIPPPIEHTIAPEPIRLPAEPSPESSD